MPFTVNISRTWRPVLIALACWSQPLVTTVTAQGLAQVTISGIPPVLQSPVISELAVGLDQGRYPLTLVLTSPDRQPLELRIRFLLERDGETVFDVESDPVVFERGIYVYTSLDQEPPLNFPVSYRELVAAAASTLGQDVSRTGLLSEGLYTLTVEARSDDPSRLLLAVPSLTTFFVQYLEPPTLLSPPPENIVSSRIPVFSWMPVLGEPLNAVLNYQLLITEVYPGQEPQQAIESNRPIEILEVSNQTVVPYTPDLLPLEAGKTYAWMVTASDADGLLPFTDDGRSEISTFVYSPSNPALAAWVYPNSRPPVTFNLSNANIQRDGYHVHGRVEGRSGEAPVGAYFDNVIIDPVSLTLLDGSVSIVGPLAENAGAIESLARPRILTDESGPTAPSLAVSKSTSSDRTRLSVSVGPSEDAESGVSTVALRLSTVGGDLTQPVEALGGWRTLFSNLEPEPRNFDGGSYRMMVPPSAIGALALGWLEVQVRVVNGLGLETITSQVISADADRSPPMLMVGNVSYSGYYHRPKPNVAIVASLQATDEESGIALVQYRLKGDSLSNWSTIAETGADRFSALALDVPLPAVDRDSLVSVEIRALNGAGLMTSWSGSVRIDIDETGPVQKRELGAFIESDVDPRVELAVDAIVDLESGIETLSYRVIDGVRPTTVYVDWTPVPANGLPEVKRTQLNFAERRNVRVQVRAENGAGLSETFSQRLSIPALAIADQTPPSSPSVSVRVLRSDPSGEVVMQIGIGESSDRESGISRVLYSIENAVSGAGLVAWRNVAGVEQGVFGGGTETASVRVPSDASAIRVVVRVTNGAGGSVTATQPVPLVAQDASPPEIRGLQVYPQGDRLMIFVDGLSDPQSFIERVEYRVIGSNGSVLVDWTNYPVVPSRRPSYGRQLLRAAVPAGAEGTAIVVQVRVFNGAGFSASKEERVQVNR